MISSKVFTSIIFFECLITPIYKLKKVKFISYKNNGRTSVSEFAILAQKWSEIATQYPAVHTGGQVTCGGGSYYLGQKAI